MDNLTDQLNAKLDELRQAISDTVGEVSAQVNTKLDELQDLVAQASAKIDQAQGQSE